MRRISTAGLCALAALVLCAVGVASASADESPEYRACIKPPRTSAPAPASPKYSGLFTDHGCTSEAPGGHYKLDEWTKAKKKTYKSKGTHPVTELINLSTHEAEVAYECKKEKGEGELTGPKTSKFIDSYSKCLVANKRCETPGAGAGNVRTEPLTTTLVPLSGGRVGELFAPTSGEVFARYNCEGLEISAEGAELGQIEGLSGAASKTWTVKLQSRGGVPGNLQEFVYVGGSGSEAEEEEAADSAEFEACIRAVHPKATCESTVGDGKEPQKPDMGFSVIKGPPAIVAPLAQNSTESSKGEVLKIV
jgi:hypothetical protein